MMSAATNDLSFAASTAVPSSQAVRSHRRISPEAGHALEKLGHAIEYLTDELINEGGGSAVSCQDRVEAIGLLISLNRRVYFDCPEVPTLRARFAAFLRSIL